MEDLIAPDIRPVDVVLRDTRVLEQLIDRLLDSFQQFGVCDNSAVLQKLQIAVNVFQQLLSRFAFAAGHIADILEGPAALGCISLGVRALKKITQLSARLIAVLDILPSTDSHLRIELILTVLCRSILEKPFDRRNLRGDLPQLFRDPGFVLDCIVYLNQGIDDGDSAGDESVDAQCRLDPGHGARWAVCRTFVVVWLIDFWYEDRWKKLDSSRRRAGTGDWDQICDAKMVG